MAYTRFAALRSWLNGDDTVAGDDTGAGGQGEDTVAGDDTAGGGGGDDTAGGSGGDDTAAGGQGDDTAGGGGSDTIDGGTGGQNADAPDANHAQYRHGFAAAQTRMAQVLTSDAAQTRLEAATGLLIEGDLSAERIIAMLPRLPKDNNSAALELLDRTKKPNLGAAAGTEGNRGGGEDAGAESRKRAIKRVNDQRRPPSGKRGKTGSKGE